MLTILQKVKIVYLFIYSFVISCFLCANLYSQDSQEKATNAISFLSLGTGARAIAMGRAFTAIADDATAVYWNPAGLGQLDKLDVLFTQRFNNVFDTNLFSLAVAYPIHHVPPVLPSLSHKFDIQILT